MKMDNNTKCVAHREGSAKRGARGNTGLPKENRKILK